MKLFYNESKTGIIFSDLCIKIGDIATTSISKELLQVIKTNAVPVYIDQNQLQEHLYDYESLEKIQPQLHEAELNQLNEIFGFMNSRHLAYVRLA